MPKLSFVRVAGLSIALLLAACDQPPQTAEKKPVAVVNPQLPDFSQFTDVKEKKRAFFGFLQPLIKRANEQVGIERSLILSWQENGEVSDAQQQQFNQLLKKYRVTESDTEKQLQALNAKVNEIPPSLILAQAANESAWGTSRFARLGNNLFGQWCFSKGCGIVPSSRNSGANHEVAKFDSPYESVASYIRNLNSHPSYEELRQLRNQELDQQNHATGMNLAAGLLKYSERGEEYVKEIRAMIRHNKLAVFDSGQEAEKNQG